MTYTINALAKLAGVSTRTLRYYDEIGLLKPADRTEGGYRLYATAEVDRLQQILFYRALDFPLEAIEQLLSAPDYDAAAAMEAHLITLKAQKERLNQLIHTVEMTILTQKGDYTMKDTEKFKGLKENHIKANEKKYGTEIRQAYGDAEIDASNEKIRSLSEASYTSMTALEAAILSALESAVTSGIAPDSEEGRRIADMHKEWLMYTWKTYTKEAHQGVAMLYTCDTRFTAYYDKQVEGCALFLQKAIQALTTV